MRTTLLLLMVIAGNFAVPASIEDPRMPYDAGIDKEALVSFALLATQRQGGNPTELLNTILSNVANGNIDELDYESQLLLLTVGGFTHEFASSVLDNLMPLMKVEGKNTQEQLMTLMFMSNRFCSKNKSDTTTCSENAQSILPLIFMQSERGCNSEEALSGEDNLTSHEICLCEEQLDAMFWLNLFEKFWQHDKETKGLPDQFPIAMMMMLPESSCSGRWKDDGGLCWCPQVTKGHEPLLMQYLFTSKEVQEKLTPSQRQAIRNIVGSPSQRTSPLNDIVYASIAESVSPQLLSLLQNQGQQDTDAMLKQLILSSVGLDSSLVHIILNNGFQDNSDKIALINYLANIGKVDASILPFILGVENGKNFYLSNLIESGLLDPAVGLLLLANQAGTSQSELLQFLIAAMANSQDNPDFFSSLGRPYVPSLPSGIFPGSQLFFAHFETLGVNTCALHDLRNRFKCGYIGISAAECETRPYCCYNPIFLTDVEASNATNNVITSAVQVPWCYYNIFFVYYNSFYMEVQKPGGFASPIQCEPIFKYGLQLDPKLYYLFDSSNPVNGIGKLVNERLECGFPGVTEFDCVAIRGCCWDAKALYRIPQCYKPNGPNSFDLNVNNIPAAYKPSPGTCNVNKNQLTLLYYFRVACHYPLDFYIAGYNILALPNRLDCLTKLGCCYEDDEEVVKTYPFVPRCYQREDGNIANIPNFPDVSSLFRSGDSVGIPGFPPVFRSND